ncbi:MAG TPA: GNAT family N-acetyltransferase [Candidatus Limnocylindria bacterium]|nr:GNAT family N-acetyltransferase [Candidatus Limnocylindria bacterium]
MSPEPANYVVRPFRPGDEAAAGSVCLRTADAGGDATGLYDDPALPGHLYVGPYLALEPALAFVLEDDQGICGYTLAALDSRRFYGRFEQEWLPPLRAIYPAPKGDPAGWSVSDGVRAQFHAPDIFWPEPYAEYPSHLHIDLLPRAQGQGNGRVLMDTLLAELRRLGSPGVHLGMHVTNGRAFHFYTRLGFRELARRGETLYLGLRLAHALDDEC